MTELDPYLKGKVALVTGASRGIGRAIAVQLARRGASVACVATTPERAQGTVDLCVAAGAKALPYGVDVGKTSAVAELVAKVQADLGGLDLLVNNAGISQRVRADVLEASEESFDELIGTNLKGPHFLTQLAARSMLDQGSGRIVYITSISAFAASINRAEYCISKAGLAMSVSLYAQRLAPHNVQVFEIRPGVIRTDMIAAVEKVYEERIAGGLIPQRRMGESADVAKAVRAIADGLLDYAAGQVLNVDGGFHMRGL